MFLMTARLSSSCHSPLPSSKIPYLSSPLPSHTLPFSLQSQQYIKQLITHMPGQQQRFLFEKSSKEFYLYLLTQHQFNYFIKSLHNLCSNCQDAIKGYIFYLLKLLLQENIIRCNYIFINNDRGRYAIDVQKYQFVLKYGRQYADEGKWNQENNLSIVRSMQQWGVQSLGIQNNYRPTLVKDILHIRFQQLAVLSMKDNYIDSVELLACVWMPSIQYLHLSENNIRSVGGLRKVRWESLSTLNLSRNYICNLDVLPGSYFPHLCTLWALGPSEVKDRMVNTCFPAKLQTSSMKVLYIEQSHFATTRSIKAVLKVKWTESFLLTSIPSFLY